MSRTTDDLIFTERSERECLTIKPLGLNSLITEIHKTPKVL